jgi:magnesium-transporting ATPase (P-type)
MNDALKFYPLWSNFIYFFAFLYSLIIAIATQQKIKQTNGNGNGNGTESKYKIFYFSIMSLFILLTFIASMVYHCYTPSFTENKNANETKEFKISLIADKIMAGSSIFIAAIIFIVRIIKIKTTKTNKTNNWFPLFKDPNFYWLILFIILSIICWVIAGDHVDEATNDEECDDQCFNVNLDAYDIFHSNWHIFAGLAAIFYLSMLNNTYYYYKKE